MNVFRIAFEILPRSRLTVAERFGKVDITFRLRSVVLAIFGALKTTAFSPSTPFEPNSDRILLGNFLACLYMAVLAEVTCFMSLKEDGMLLDRVFTAVIPAMMSEGTASRAFNVGTPPCIATEILPRARCFSSCKPSI